MTGNEFLRKITRLGRANGLPVYLDKAHVKGSHGTLYYGSRRTTLKDPKSELGRGLLRHMLSDLGLAPGDLNESESALMVQTIFAYPASLEPDEDGRAVVTFPDLPGAVTDSADQAEALVDAADCLSQALATRISHGEEIPPASPAQPDQYVVLPDPTIALKAALYTQLRERDMTVADLADRLGVEWHQAARLIDPKWSSKLTNLSAALAALGCRIGISIEPLVPGDVDTLVKHQRGPETPRGSGRLLLRRRCRD